MSRIGKLPIEIPPGVEVKLEENKIKVKGPKGELMQAIHPKVKIDIEGNNIIVRISDESDKFEKSLWGTTRRIVANMVHGVTSGFQKQLESIGVGYKVALSGNKLTFNVGYSHPVEYVLPPGTQAAVEKNIITISGADKQQVGQIASEIRSIRKPEPYKGKGIKYVDEIIIKKAGKAAKAVGGKT